MSDSYAPNWVPVPVEEGELCAHGNPAERAYRNRHDGARVQTCHAESLRHMPWPAPAAAPSTPLAERFAACVDSYANPTNAAWDLIMSAWDIVEQNNAETYRDQWMAALRAAIWRYEATPRGSSTGTRGSVAE